MGLRITVVGEIESAPSTAPVETGVTVIDSEGDGADAAAVIVGVIVSVGEKMGVFVGDKVVCKFNSMGGTNLRIKIVGVGVGVADGSVRRTSSTRRKIVTASVFWGQKKTHKATVINNANLVFLINTGNIITY